MFGQAHGIAPTFRLIILDSELMPGMRLGAHFGEYFE
jgi:hypothetical protein